MANPFVHLELNTPDLAAAKEFYGKLFNWTFEDNDMGGGMVYSTFKPESGPGGGIFSIPDAPVDWLPTSVLKTSRPRPKKQPPLAPNLYAIAMRFPA